MKYQSYCASDQHGSRYIPYGRGSARVAQHDAAVRAQAQLAHQQELRLPAASELRSREKQRLAT